MFLGREVDPDGPLWLAEDRRKVLAVLEDRARRCTGCGQLPEDIEFALPDGTHIPLDPPLLEVYTHRCFACETVEDTMAAIPTEERRGIYPRLRAFTEDEPMDLRTVIDVEPSALLSSFDVEDRVR